MRLRKPCEHGWYCGHQAKEWCPGGEFLAEGELVKVWWCVAENEVRLDGSIPWQCECGSAFCPGHERCDWVYLIPAEALASQVGESE